MLANLFGSVCSLDIAIETEPGRKFGYLGRDSKDLKYPIFVDREDVCGVATVEIKPGKKLDHYGIKVELIGKVESLQDRNSNYDFFSITKELEPPGILAESRRYKWQFNAVDKQHETYSGTNARLRYLVKLTAVRQYASNIVKEADFIVQNVSIPPEINNTIKMEVGIEDCLHIEFEYDKAKYHLRDVVVGKVYFLLVRLKIKHMQLDILKMETVGSGNAATTDTETISKFEIMDGAPIRAEHIPVRLYLGSADVTPTYKGIQNKFSVRYFLNLLLVDEEERRYFKKQEIVLWRKKIG